LRPPTVYDMNKPVWYLAASLYLVASYPGPAVGEAVVAYEYAGEWDRFGPALEVFPFLTTPAPF
jgi:hypothetical protein